MQDILGLGSEARMNTPSLYGGNWRWRLRENQLSGDDVASKMALLAEVSDRLPKPFASQSSDSFFA
jgi:4-alpha-glucanotransferase